MPSKDPLMATDNPKTWTKSQKIGAIVFSVLIVIGWIGVIREGVFSESSNFLSWISGCLITGFINRDTLKKKNKDIGNLFNVIKITFSESLFDEFVITYLVSWIYLLAQTFFWGFNIRNLLLIDQVPFFFLLLSSIFLMISLRVLLEALIALIKIAENTSNT